MVWLKAYRRKGIRHLLAGPAVFAACLVLAGVLEYARARQDAVELSGAAERIERRIEAQTGLLTSLRAFIDAGDYQIEIGRLRRFLELLGADGMAAGMQGIGIALYQQSSDVSEAEHILELAYGDGIHVWPATSLPHRFPIVLLEPDNSRNRAAYGYDMYSEPVRRDAIDRAWKSGRAAATGPVELVQEITSKKQVGFLIYLPVGKRGGSGIHSMVYAPYRVGDLMQNALTQPTDLGVVARVRDKATGQLMLDAQGTPASALKPFSLHVADREWTIDLAFRDRTWTLGRDSTTVLLVGLLVAFLAHRLALQREGRIAAERAAAAEVVQAAEMRGLLLEETRHRLKNVIARISAIARLTARQTHGKEEFEAAFQRQLSALAAAQSLLSPGLESGVDLRQLIMAELSSVGGAPEDVRLDGPDITLSGNEAQAIGLVIHELLTNALKYGALSTTPAGSLEIRWLRDDDLVLEWLERGRFDFNESAAGFGGRLIETVIVKQLRGRQQRSVEAGLYSQTIRWKHVPQPTGGNDA